MPAPGVGVTLWSASGPAAALSASREILADLRPAFAVLHGWPGAGTPKLIQELRELVPGVRVWISPGANGLAAKSPEACAAQGRAWRAFCDAHGVEVLMPNIERPSAPGLPGWVVDSVSARAPLEDSLRALLDGCAGGAALVGITSHDWPGTHPLPRIAYQHAAVALVLPQVYPATGTKELASRRTAQGRLSATLSRWASYSHVRPDLRPSSRGWGIYGQLWGHSAAAVAWLADQADVYSGWAVPLVPKGRAQREGIVGLRLALECRRRYGEGAGAILRAQRALGLVPDGLPGPATASALGLEWAS